MTHYRKAEPGCLEQNSILRSVDLHEFRFSDAGVQFGVSTYAWLVVLNQDCDLRLDRLARANLPGRPGGNPVNADKLLRSVLLCPAFPLQDVLFGTYIPGAAEWRGTEKRILEDNRHERYHVLLAEEPLIPASLAMDFKLVIAAPPAYLEDWVVEHPESMVAVVDSPYKERLTQRFVHYFSRIAEPDEE